MADEIDEVLDILHATGPEFGGGLSNHGPMAAEAMLALGRPDPVLDWVRGYTERLQPPPAGHAKIQPGDWQSALGDTRRFSDWIAFFDEQLAESSWEQVVRTWVPRLAPALMSAATHGLIRTGHAVRSLSRGVTPQRTHELAQGLGYWAARYQVLPGVPSDETRNLMPGQALEQVRRINGPDFTGSGLIFDQLRGLDDESSFPDVINLVPAQVDLSDLLSGITETFARVYLSNDNGMIGFVHAVTAPSILRVFAPYLDEADARLAARFAWQAGAALYAWYCLDPHDLDAERLRAPVDRETLIDRAVSTTGAHTIKFTEACLREHSINPNPIYLAAAADACDRVGAI